MIELLMEIFAHSEELFIHPIGKIKISCITKVKLDSRRELNLPESLPSIFSTLFAFILYANAATFIVLVILQI